MDSKIEDATKRLFIAIKENESGQIKGLIQEGANLATQNDMNQTAIHFASALSHWKCVKAIAENAKTDKEDTFQFGTALLYVSAKQDTSDIAQLLLEDGAKITKACNDENTCLHHAVIKKNTQLLTLLLNHQLNVTSTNKKGQTPLDLACILGHLSCAQILIEDVSFKNFKFKNTETGGLSFLAAIKADQLDIAKILLKVGASSTEMTLPDKNTSLHWVAKKWKSYSSKSQVIQFILENGGNLIAQNRKGQTPIELAAQLGYWDCVQHMLAFENNKNPKKSEERYQALHLEKVLIYAVKQGDCTYTQLLLEKGVSPNSFDGDMGTITLYWAVKNNDDIILKLLLTHKVNTTRLTRAGLSALDFAKEWNLISCIELLEGKTPLQSTATQPASSKVDLIEATRGHVTRLFDSLCDKDIKPEKIPTTIDDFVRSYQKILEHDKAYFQEARSNFRKQLFPEGPFLTSVTDTNTQAGAFTPLLQFINGLLDSAKPIPLLNYPLRVHVVEERDIQYYLECMKPIEEYKNRVHIFLIVNLKTKIEKIKAETDFLDELMCPIPGPIHAIYEILQKEELLKMPSMGNIFRAYLEVIRQFENTNALKGGDKKVQELCAWATEFIKSMTFLPENVVNETPTYPTELTINNGYVPYVTNTNTNTMYQPPNASPMYPYMTNIEIPQTQYVPVLAQITPTVYPSLNQYGFLSTAGRNQDTLSDNPGLHALLGFK